ncbi:MAG: outer-membrane lipoprotein carrier protein LolA [Thermosulfidibacteraceae bacterium]|jgi:outer membrane lipoprotein-sorting protein
MKKAILVLFLMMIFSYISFDNVYAQTLVDVISEKYASAKLIRGEFNQQTIFPDGKTLNHKGHFTITPTLSEWVYTYPERQKIITKGKEVFIIKGDKIEKAELMINTNIYNDLIKNLKKTTSEFNVFESNNKIILLPKQKNINIEKIIITTAGLTPKSIEIVDKVKTKVVMNIKIKEVK